MLEFCAGAMWPGKDPTSAAYCMSLVFDQVISPPTVIIHDSEGSTLYNCNRTIGIR